VAALLSRAWGACRRAGFQVGLYGNIASPYKAKLEAAGLTDITRHCGFSCDDGGLQPSLSFLRQFCVSTALPPEEVAVVLSCRDHVDGSRYVSVRE
jgi:hypothetical protein